MLKAVHVLGDYWHADTDEPTPLGVLLAGVKSANGADELRELETLLAHFVQGLDLPLGAAVVAVPPGPDRDEHPVPSLAACVAETLDVDDASALLWRSNSTARLRDTPPERRRDVVEAAGYAADPLIAGRDVVLVDDVILTGTTLGYLAELLAVAGARSVRAVVAARTRLGGESLG